MSADPSFGDRVLVTSAATRVDTDVLVAAALTLHAAAGRTARTLALLESAAEVCRSRLTLVPLEASTALAVVEDARVGTLALLGDLESLAESLSYAALVYLGAEGRVAAFRDAWTGTGAGEGQTWATGLGSLHSRRALRALVPGDLDEHVPGAWLDRLLAPLLPLVLGGALSGHSQLRSSRGAGTTGVSADPTGHASGIRPGSLWGDGDPVSGLRLQMDLHAGSELVADHTPSDHSLPRGPGAGRSADGQGPPSSPWWGTPDGATPGAASLAASWALGLGRIPHPSTRGVQVTGAVPVDTLDMRTGRPTGVRGKHSVVDSDVGARGGGVNLTPGNLGLTTLPSLVGTALGAIPTTQGGAPVPAAPRAGAPHRVDTPRRPSQALGRITGLGGSGTAGQVEILRHRSPTPAGGERTSWSVVIRGTQQWGVGGANPQDMLSNLQTVAGEPSDQSRAVLAAMEQVGVGAGEPVELVGHSQGGAVAAQLASDPEVTARYRVTSVLTAGSPAGGAQPVPGVAMLNLENTRDPVPALDGSANRDLGASRTVHFDGGLLGVREDEGGSASPHSLTTYRAAMSWLEAGAGVGAGTGAGADTGTGTGERGALGGVEEVRGWMEERERSLGLGEGTRTTAFTLDTQRLPAGG